MLKNMKLSTKLLLSFLGVGILPFAVVGVTTLYESSTALQQEAVGKLKAVRETKKNQMQEFFAERNADMDVMVRTVAKVRDEAFHKLESVQKLKKNQIQQYLDKVQDDITVLSQSKAVESAYKKLKAYHDAEDFGPESPYDVKTEYYRTIWQQFDTSLGNYVTKFGYYDVFIICRPHGHVMYSYAKENDLGTNLGHGPYKEEGLAKLWRKVVQQDRIAVQDFSPYSPSQGQEAMFIGGPIDNDEGETIGVVALQVPTDKINQIVQQRQGLGSTGETYLAANEGNRIEFRSTMQTMGDGKFVVGYDVTDIAPEYLTSALDGEKVHDVFTDSSGNPVIVSAQQVSIGKDKSWAMVTKQNLEEALVGAAGGGEGKKDYFTRFIDKKGYYDLFLINENGYVYYSSAREADYNTNMVDGKFSDSGLGKLTRRVLRTKEYQVADFEPYAPSDGKPAAFIAQPLTENGHVESVVAMQLSLQAINKVMQERAGMGETGETYLVGQDKLMRSDSFLDPEGHSVQASFAGNVENNGVDTLAAEKALSGKTGAEIITDYNGNRVLSAYAPLQVSDNLTWGLLAEVNKAEAFAAVDKMQWLIGIVALIAIAVIIAVAMLITRSITKPINRIIAGLSEGADQVASASNQVSSSSQSLAEGSSEQASSLEETSSSLEEMSSQTKQNADNAGQADATMKETAQVVESGVSSMERMSQAIEDIRNSSSETSRIIKTIDDIAFQTNLLALNAAVEAARAGDAGKGFAVVAEEVRNLAQRSAEAAKNTSELIEKSQNSSENGVAVAEEVSSNLHQIKESSNKVSNLLSEISAASKEQSQGIDQVNNAVADMDKVTQQNASNAEESSSAAEELDSQAQQMKSMVEELVAIVGSSGTGNNGSGPGKSKIRSGGQQQPRSPQQPEHAKRTDRSGERTDKQQREHQAPSKSGGYQQQHRKSEASEQVIPLDEDEFRDF